MKKRDQTSCAAEAEQLKKYAEDLARVYSTEQEKSVELDRANKQLINYATDLGTTLSELKDKHRELKDAYLDTINKLVVAAEYKDEDTGDHIVRISRYSSLIAEKLALSKDEIFNIRYASPMHDIGKIGIPDSILLKPAKLTDEEFDKMKEHSSIGAHILSGSPSEVLQAGQQIAISHHEKYNGRGYPQGHAGEKIPLSGRIVCLVDVFDALTSRRPYKDPYPVEVACDIIKKESGEQLDPKIVDVFLENIDEIVKIKGEVGNAEDVSLDGFTWSERDVDDGK